MYFHFMILRTALLVFIFTISSMIVHGQEMGLPFIIEEQVNWFKPLGMGSKAIQNRSMEVGVLVPSELDRKVDLFLSKADGGLNPFDPAQVNVWVEFKTPKGLKKRQNAFFYQDQRRDYQNDQFVPVSSSYRWRIRYSPAEVGRYEATVFIEFDESVERVDFQFESVESPNKGRLTTKFSGTNADRYLYFKQSGNPFYAIGENISSAGFFTMKPSQMQFQLNALNQLATARGNFTRLEMSAQGPLPEWGNLSDYSSKADEMYAFDQVIDYLEKRELYAIVFRHHVEVNGDDWDVPNWENNPNRKALGLKSVYDYFMDTNSIQAQKNSIRYQFARWGYSPYFAFYGFSEVDNWIQPLVDEGFSEVEASEIFEKWYLKLAKYIKEELNPEMMMVNSYASIPKYESKRRGANLLEESDIIALHKYGAHKGLNFDDRANKMSELYDRYQKPVLLEEMGVDPDKLSIYCCTGVEFHNAFYASAFMGGLGTGMEWWWNRGVHDFGYIRDIECIHYLMQKVDLAQGNYAPQKYTDAKERKRTIESYSLVGDSSRTAIGWVKNATVYWRNLTNQYECLDHLVEQGCLDFVCEYKEGKDIFKNDTNRSYQSEIYTDAFTEQGAIKIGTNEDLTANPEIEIVDLKPSRFGKKNRQWYQVDFYLPDPMFPFQPITKARQFVHTNFFGKLKFHILMLSPYNRDYLYHVTYLGEGENNPKLKRLKQ